MISIIICSRTQTIDVDLSKNIKKTVGSDYELIVVDNSKNKHSIFEAYNIGIGMSVGDYVCFMHDDILFNTQDWGNILIGIFENNKEVGLIGVAGAKIKSKMPSAWWDCPDDQKAIYIIQHFKDKVKEKWDFGFNNETFTRVVAIDGVFMAMRKDHRIKYNTSIKGFHNYDLNISFEYKKWGYEIIASREILLEHFSMGSLNEQWVDSSYQIYSLYKKILPLSIHNKKKVKKNEIDNALIFINICLKHQKYKIAILFWFKLLLLKPVSKFHYRFCKRIIKRVLC